ncbi:helicase-associated domain-containing protein [Sinomonas sp. ASV322]|uniref:helicase-associated domain-containing protein n=1 Tax=Sinomonas sp. ASV322 TaxID=3041920 RepID=UPI0027DB004C|nr:helicase-associated domain-containing protein [Sinomonas sp. ASV322]MDQ4503184.1 helicase-associated domain-containing protein [Sinomonas sp. ASV322]
MSSIRALAEELAARGNDSLRRLFAARSDLIAPGVPDFAALAARACARLSLQRALETLSKPQLEVLEALVLTTDEDEGRSGSAVELRHAVGSATLGTLDSILAELSQLALTYRADPPDSIHSASGSRRRYYQPVARVREVLGSYPAGLGRCYTELTAVSAFFAERAAGIVNAIPAATPQQQQVEHHIAAAYALERWAGLPEALDGAPSRTREVLEKFTNWPVGAVPHAEARVRPGRRTENPVDWLLSHGLLVPIDDEHVELPRPVGLALRGGRIVPELSLEPPAPPTATTSVALRRNAALGAIGELLRLVSGLAVDAAERPIETLRAGGVGIRELRRLTSGLRAEADQTVLALELAAAAGIITLDVDTSTWRATAAEEWLALSRPDQWLLLATSWLDTARVPTLAMSSEGGAQLAPLAGEGQRPDAAAVRRRILEVAAELSAEADAPEGRACVVSPGDIRARFEWAQPRLARRLRGLLEGVLAEAAMIGFTGSDAVTHVGAAVLRGDFDSVRTLLEEILPPSVDRILLQADLTAVAPGYLEPALARRLALLADAEGRGPATIYRFSAASLRRALDAGEDAASISEFLVQHAETGVPQPLAYLVDDTASRYGRIRVGRAGSFVAGDDEATIAGLLREPAAQQLGFTQIAPSVVVSNATPQEVATVLRELGHAPAVDSSLEPVVRLRRVRGAAAPGLPTPAPRPAVPNPDDVEAQLNILRNQSAVSSNGDEVAPMLGIETLQKAIRLKRAVRLNIVDALGNSTVEELRPVSISAGRVRVFDPERETERVLSVHRIIDVELA